MSITCRFNMKQKSWTVQELPLRLYYDFTHNHSLPVSRIVFIPRKCRGPAEPARWVNTCCLHNSMHNILMMSLLPVELLFIVFLKKRSRGPNTRAEGRGRTVVSHSLCFIQTFPASSLISVLAVCMFVFLRPSWHYGDIIRSRVGFHLLSACRCENMWAEASPQRDDVEDVGVAQLCGEDDDEKAVSSSTKHFPDWLQHFPTDWLTWRLISVKKQMLRSTANVNRFKTLDMQSGSCIDFRRGSCWRLERRSHKSIVLYVLKSPS